MDTYKTDILVFPRTDFAQYVRIMLVGDVKMRTLAVELHKLGDFNVTFRSV